ncbi:uroporphyrinogen-III synthase [Rhodohalobacter halophilus]|uniref:uroporphyrinogen-III synthase n=1 Tax=Rhodohalobacter halophilus TaxID=1812810 RepID=UPI00083FB5A0|nr:uroporphyrinogen-III synthase [Rhodohalobacter halophilus]
MILLTADKDIAAPFLEMESVQNIDFLHLPLEKFTYSPNREESDELKHRLSEFSFIIHGNLRNARFFVEWVKENDLQSEVINCVNIVLDKPTAIYLETHGIPAIQPRQPAKPIDILEFMLRISKEGYVLYPTTENKTEEMPGLLKELEMPVAEFTVCKEVTLDESELSAFQKELKLNQIDGVILHNRSAYIRVKTAFPELDLNNSTLIAGSLGLTEMLEEDGLKPDYLAKGSWASMAKVLSEIE